MFLKEKIDYIKRFDNLKFSDLRSIVRKKMSCAPIGVGNIKTQTVSTYRSVGKNCPSDCSFLNNGCYAQDGNVNIHQNRAKELENEAHLNSFLLGYIYASKNDIPMRLHTSGDFFYDDKLDVDYVQGIKEIIEACIEAGIPAPALWTYTHRKDEGLDCLREWISIRLSGFDGPMGAIVVDSYEEHKRKKGQFLCPNSIDKSISCKSCTLCWTIKGTVVFKNTARKKTTEK